MTRTLLDYDKSVEEITHTVSSGRIEKGLMLLRVRRKRGIQLEAPDSLSREVGGPQGR